MVVGFASLDQTGGRRALVEALQQRPDRLETQPRVAPVQPCERIESVGFDRLDDLRLKRPLLGGGAKGAIAHMAPRTTCNLRDFGGIKPAGTTAVELVNFRESNVVDIHVKPHPDRIGGDEIIDLAGLEHADLRVTRPRAQGTENDRCSASLAPDKLREREYVPYGKGNYRAARR